MQSHRTKENSKATIGKSIETATQIGFENFAAGVLYVGTAREHTVLTFHAAPESGAAFMPIAVVDLQEYAEARGLDPEGPIAVAFPVETIGAPRLKITGDADQDLETSVSFKS